MQTRMMTVMLLCGAALGVAYDLLGMMRRLFSKSVLIGTGGDLLLGGVCATSMITAGLWLRQNPFRLFAFSGVAAGFAVYMLTLGTIVRFFCSWVYRNVKKSFILDKKF